MVPDRVKKGNLENYNSEYIIVSIVGEHFQKLNWGYKLVKELNSDEHFIKRFHLSY